MKDEIASTIWNHQVVVISVTTGSGKTTQVPQFVLDELISTNRGAHANILVTQPRLISVIGVAKQVSAERCEKCGQTVGYSIKLEKKMSGRTRLLLCTTDSTFAIKNESESNQNRLSKTTLKRLYHPKYNPQVIHSLSVVDENLINYAFLPHLLEHICLNEEEGAILDTILTSTTEDCCLSWIVSVYPC
jgi:hypothetical protein